MSRRGHLAAAIAVLLVVDSATVVIRLRHDEHQDPMPREQLLIHAPDTLQAGEEVLVEISGIEDGTEQVAVVAESRAGAVQDRAAVADGRARTRFEGAATAAAGPLLLWAWTPRGEATALVEVLPGPAVEPVVPLVGPKSIVADGSDHAMVVAVPADAHGNPVPGRGRTRFDVLRGSGARVSLPNELSGLAVWARIFSGTVAGRSAVSASLDGAGGPAGDLDEVPGRPTPFVLRRDEPATVPLVADGRRLHGLITDRITDAFGNVVPDGTSVRFVMTDPTGVRQSDGVTIDGTAALLVEAPDLPGVLVATAVVAGIGSNQVRLDFAAAPRGVPVRVRSEDGWWSLDVGPVESVVGGWIPDGTEVTYERGDGEEIRAVLRGGLATFRLAEAPARGARVTVLGVRGEVPT